MSAKAKFSNEVTDHAVQGFIVSLHRLRSQHMLPQETSHRLPLLTLTRNTHTARKLTNIQVIIATVHTIQQHYLRVLPIFIITPIRVKADLLGRVSCRSFMSTFSLKLCGPLSSMRMTGTKKRKSVISLTMSAVRNDVL